MARGGQSVSRVPPARRTDRECWRSLLVGPGSLLDREDRVHHPVQPVRNALVDLTADAVRCPSVRSTIAGATPQALRGLKALRVIGGPQASLKRGYWAALSVVPLVEDNGVCGRVPRERSGRPRHRRLNRGAGNSRNFKTPRNDNGGTHDTVDGTGLERAPSDHASTPSHLPPLLARPGQRLPRRQHRAGCLYTAKVPRPGAGRNCRAQDRGCA